MKIFSAIPDFIKICFSLDKRSEIYYNIIYTPQLTCVDRRTAYPSRNTCDSVFFRTSLLRPR